jgi:predicted component of type VI protein secretion system
MIACAPLVGGAGLSPLKRIACHARTATPDKIGGSSTARASSRCRRCIRSSPWEQRSPYWWQTVTAAPPFGMRFEPSATYAQPNDIWSQSCLPWTPPAVPSTASTGILGQLAQPANESPSYPLPKATSLLAQFLTGAGMAQPTQNGSQTETEAGLSNYVTPAQSRSSNMAHCLPDYVKCHDLHGGSVLRNGKRCGDCFNMCLLYGTWPQWYCPIY